MLSFLESLVKLGFKEKNSLNQLDLMKVAYLLPFLKKCFIMLVLKNDLMIYQNQFIKNECAKRI